MRRLATIVLGLGLWGSVAAAPGTAPQDVSTGDHLSLTLGDDGALSKLSLDSKDLPLATPGGFYLQDMSRKALPQDIPVQGRTYPGTALRGGSVEKIAEGGLRHQVVSAALGVAFEARYLPRDGHLEIQTRLKN